MIRVLVVEDEPVAADAHAEYVRRVPGFDLAGRATTGAEALRLLRVGGVDLVLLDLNLPDMHGLDIIRTMRAGGHDADVIAVTSARDLAVVRSAVSQGIVQYLLKPFSFATFREKLERYREYREQGADDGVVTGQHEVDRMLATLRGTEGQPLPKGVSPESLDAVVGALRRAEGAMSAAEIAEALGVSRVTARRYLEHLADVGVLARHMRYGGAGRPVVEYRRTAPPPTPR
ncbi:MAG: putative two-component system response regulator [Cryptosporangiaceae bacterium]|jgi:response regulator of citrate/malate metabolism|nr:putative two-component system response regulator [Cryptosporangiaceae bacterium]